MQQYLLRGINFVGYHGFNETSEKVIFGNEHLYEKL